MQTIAAQLEQAFRTAIREAFGLEADPLVGVAQNEKFGDYQSNAAMGLAKQVSESTGTKTNPRAVAEQVKAKVTPLLADIASEISIAGPGFINVRLKPEWLAAQLQAVGREHRLVPTLAESDRQRVVVDYSAPNVAKELHVGHLRSTIIGDAIARTLDAQGHDVLRQNHIGDWGTQFGMLIAHVRSLGAAPAADASAAIEDLNALYLAANKRFKEDEAFAAEARQTVVRLQGGGEQERTIWEQIVEASRRYYSSIYQQLGVGLARGDERGESFYNPKLPDVVRELAAAGIAAESEGAKVIFIEGYEAPLIIEKSGGGYLYATTDLAAIRYRVEELHAKRIIYVVGAPQSQHFAQVFAAARKAGWAGDVQLEHAAFGSVLGEDGKLIRGRHGTALKLKDLLDEAEERAFAIVSEKSPDTAEDQRRRIAHAVGIGAVKYADLSKDRTSDYIFAWDRMLSFEGNTAPYLQNAYVRIHGIFRKAKANGVSVDVDPAALRLESPFELALGKHVLRIGEVIGLVARELKPHHLCNYLYELATKYHAFFENCPVLQSDEQTRASRLALCRVVAETLGFGLDLLGIEHPEQM